MSEINVDLASKVTNTTFTGPEIKCLMLCLPSCQNSRKNFKFFQSEIRFDLSAVLCFYLELLMFDLYPLLHVLPRSH